MTLRERLQRQLEIRRKNQDRILPAPDAIEAPVHLAGVDPSDELVSDGGRGEGAGSCNISVDGLEAEARQSIARQLERLRNFQEKSPRNSRGLPVERALQSDLGGEIRATTAGSFLYLTELCEESGALLSGDDPRSNRQRVLQLIDLLLGMQIECEPSGIAFLDTETTGLSGGSGTYAFLVGIGSWNPLGFSVEQFFMRDFDEEAAMLSSLQERLSQVEVIVTFNGKSFDLPLLESRFVMHRLRWPLTHRPHLDLLHPSRRLWKLRLRDCSLGNLERHVLGWEREGDVPGHLIPQLYFNYARTGVPTGLKAILQHNRQDIRTLAELTLVVARIFGGSASREDLATEDLFGAARYLAALGQRQRSLQFGQEALGREGPQSLKVEVLRQLARIHRSQKTYFQAAMMWQQMMATSRSFHAEACENLAIYYEHRAGDPAKALDLVEDAIQQIEGLGSGRSTQLDRWLHRRSRLQKKIGRVSSINL